MVWTYCSAYKLALDTVKEVEEEEEEMEEEIGQEETIKKKMTDKEMEEEETEMNRGIAE